MFETVADLSDSLRAADDLLGADAFETHLRDAERPYHVLASDSVEYTTGERTMTFDPDGQHRAYLVITDERVLLVLGDQSDELEAALPLHSISECAVESGLLETTFVVGTSGETIRVSPVAGDAEAARSFIERTTDCYEAVQPPLEEAHRLIQTLEAGIIEGGDESARLQIQSCLSEASHSVPDDADLPTERLDSLTAEVRAEFHRRYVDAWLDRGEDALDAAIEAVEAQEYDVFASAYGTAAEAVAALDSAREVFETLVAEDRERIDTFVKRVRFVSANYAKATKDTLDAAKSGDDQPAAEEWLRAFRRYEAIAGESFDDRAAIDLDPARLETLAPRTVTALVTRARELESDGAACETADPAQASEYYERAIERLRQAREVATQWSVDVEESFGSRIETLESKVERTEWEWGPDPTRASE